MGVRKLGMRYGMYTDDTQTALALATSLVENQALDPCHAGLAATTDGTSYALPLTPFFSLFLPQRSVTTSSSARRLRGATLQLLRPC